ncbi:MAG: cytochrome c-type biogenesis protein CcmH [Halieaceae bacterium]|nr:cytochrome c-type biogenesis protein CcmH [Halieaceae bacterium]
MKALRLILLMFTLSLWATAAVAVVETYQFDNDEQRQRYQQFTAELRCPKCQNQNLDGSNSPIAQDLRRELHRLIVEGNSDQQVVAFMVDRYGEFVLYRPPFNLRTALLWLAPAILLLCAAIMLLWVLRRQRQMSLQGDAPPEKSLSDEERAVLAVILKNDEQQKGVSGND